MDLVRLIPYASCYEDALVPFVASFWATHHKTVDPDEARNMLREWLEEDVSMYVVEYGGEAVGFLRTHNSNPTVCWIDDIFVDAPHRRKGIAAGAIGLLEARLREQGVKSFCMEVVPDNLPALKLYHRLGYDRLSLITMRKDLEPFEAERTETIAGLPLRVKRFE